MNTKLLFYTILFFATIFASLYFRGGWIEPDTYAFISRACGTSTFETPSFSLLFFQSLGCNPIAWYLTQAFLWAFSFWFVAKYFIQKKIPIEALFVIGFSLSAIYSFLSIEDDYLVTALLIVLSYWLYDKTTNYKRIAFGLFVAINYFFVWKGTVIVGAIILAGTINPILPILLVFGYISQSGFDTWGGSAEAVIFGGLTVFLPIIFLLFYSTKKKFQDFYSHSKPIAYTFVSLVLLGFFQAKWGFYSAIFLPIIFYHTIEKQKFREICVIGGIIVLLSVAGLALTKSPRAEHWSVLEKALEIEREGNTVYISNTFGLEKWGYEYKGGHPAQYDPRKQTRPFYYLGVSKIIGCTEKLRADDLWVGQCS